MSDAVEAARERLLKEFYTSYSDLNVVGIVDAIVAVARAVRDTSPPVPCVYDLRLGMPLTTGEYWSPDRMGAWCQTHGWYCPGNKPTC
jgi:hypothetical protein